MLKILLNAICIAYGDGMQNANTLATDLCMESTAVGMYCRNTLGVWYMSCLSCLSSSPS